MPPSVGALRPDLSPSQNVKLYPWDVVNDFYAMACRTLFYPLGEYYWSNVLRYYSNLCESPSLCKSGVFRLKDSGPTLWYNVHNGSYMNILKCVHANICYCDQWAKSTHTGFVCASIKKDYCMFNVLYITVIVLTLITVIIHATLVAQYGFRLMFAKKYTNKLPSISVILHCKYNSTTRSAGCCCFADCNLVFIC